MRTEEEEQRERWRRHGDAAHRPTARLRRIAGVETVKAILIVSLVGTEKTPGAARELLHYSVHVSPQGSTLSLFFPARHCAPRVQIKFYLVYFTLTINKIRLYLTAAISI